MKGVDPVLILFGTAKQLHHTPRENWNTLCTSQANCGQSHGESLTAGSHISLHTYTSKLADHVPELAVL